MCYNIYEKSQCKDCAEMHSFCAGIFCVMGACHVHVPN